MTASHGFPAAVSDALGDCPLATVATAAELPRDAIRNVLAGHDPRLSRADEICRALGLELYIGPPRGEVPRSGGVRFAPFRGRCRIGDTPRLGVSRARDHSHRDGRRRRSGTGGSAACAGGALGSDLADPDALANAANENEIPPGARPVDVVELAAADERVAGRLWFTRAWLDRRGIDATRCVAIGVRGESMDPTLPEGCSILVDRARMRRRSGRIYVVLGGDGLIVKRAVKDETSQWLLASDNPAPEYAPIPWPADAETIGEVRWMARSVT